MSYHTASIFKITSSHILPIDGLIPQTSKILGINSYLTEISSGTGRSIVGTSACYRLSLQALFIFYLGIALYLFSESWISDLNFGSQQVSVNQWFDSVLIYISTSAISVSDITTAKSSQIKSRASLLSITMNMRTDCI